MYVTREMDYAIRILRALGKDAPLTAPEIAEKEHLQQAVTYKMLKKLAAAGYLKGKRGSVGGYVLIKDCAETTLYELFSALVGPLYLTECLERGYCCENNSESACKVHREFALIQSVLDSELKRTTLDRLF